MNLERPTARQRLEHFLILAALGGIIVALVYFLGLLCGNLGICIG